MWDVVTFVFPCFSSGCFIVTKMALDESGYLDQVDVRVEKVNEASGYRRALAVTWRDETRCTVIKPVNNSVLGRYRIFKWGNTRRSKDGQVWETQEGRVEENMGGII